MKVWDAKALVHGKTRRLGGVLSILGGTSLIGLVWQCDNGTLRFGKGV